MGQQKFASKVVEKYLGGASFSYPVSFLHFGENVNVFGTHFLKLFANDPEKYPVSEKMLK